MWSRKQTPAESKMASRDDMSKHDGSALCVATAVAPSEISWEKRSWQICGRFTSVKVYSKCFAEENAQPKNTQSMYESQTTWTCSFDGGGSWTMQEILHIEWWVVVLPLLGGGFKIFFVFLKPYLGKIPILTNIFQRRLGQPPTMLLCSICPSKESV